VNKYMIYLKYNTIDVDFFYKNGSLKLV